MSLMDLAHKSLVLGLVGITLYYGTTMAVAVPSIVQRHAARTKAAQEAAETPSTPSS